MNSQPPTSSPLSASFADLSDADLLAAVTRLAACEARATADLVASLAEVDLRRLYLEQGFSSLFAYCVQHLHLGESATANRIEAARAGRRFPLILERLREGSLTLTAVRLLAPHLTESNHREVLDAAHHATRSRVEHLVAQLNPKPDVASLIRKLPARKMATDVAVVPPQPANRTQFFSPRTFTMVADMQDVSRQPDSSSVPPHTVEPRTRESVSTTGSSAAEAVPLFAQQASAIASPPARSAETVAAAVRPRPSVLVAPLAPERYKVQMTVGAETYARLRRAQDLLRHTIPSGDVAEIFDQALTVLLERLERRRLAVAKHPRAVKREPPSGSETSTRAPGRSRHIPADVKRAVWQRDRGRCTYVGANGHVCGETRFLEYHHRRPIGDGGETTIENISLLCKFHNQREGERYFAFTREPEAAKRAAASGGNQERAHDRAGREHVSKHVRGSAAGAHGPAKRSPGGS